MAFAEKIKKLIDGEETTESNNTYVRDNIATTSDIGVVSNNQMILVEPRAYSESQTIADHLKAKNTVVVNLKRVTAAQAKRIIDFLTGTLYAISGDLQKIGPGIYLCTPENVSVQGKISEEEDGQIKNKDEDEIDW